MRYHNLDIWLQGDGPHYTTRGCCKEPHGGEIPDEASAVDLAEVERIQVRILRNKDVDERFLSAAGKTLFGFLFGTGRLHNQLHACCGAAADKEEGVRIRLRIASPDMAAVPWEYASDYKGFLATRPETAIVRYHEVPRPIEKLDTRLPARVLVVVPEESRLDTHLELEALESALQGKASLVIMQGRVTLDRLVEELHAGNEYHVLHFIGHGAVHDGRAYLVLNREDGGEDEVDHEALGKALEAHESLKLVVLNCCEGAAVALGDAGDQRARDGARAFIGLAPELVRAGVPAVLAMQYEITDEEAIFFAKVFYGNLFSRREGGRIEVAAARARHALEARRGRGRTVGAPVLYLHAEEGVLFELRHQNLLGVPGLPKTPKLLELLDRLLALPFGRRAADTTYAVAHTRERNLMLRESGASGGDPEMAKRMEDDRASLKALRRRLQGVAAAAVGLTLVFLSSIGLDSRLPMWLRPEYHAVKLGNYVAGPPFSDALQLVVIDAPSIRELSPDSLKVDRKWRRHHAELVRKLAAAGARVIAFDIYFESSSEYDADFAGAIRDAAEKTRVVVGVQADTLVPGPGGTVVPQPKLVDAIATSGASWGALCAGVHPASPNTVPLLFRDVQRGTRVESLVLRAVGAYTGASQAAFDAGRSEVHLVRPHGAVVQSVPVLPPAFAAAGQGCSIINADDELYEMIVNFVSTDVLRDPAHRSSYAEVLRAPPAALGRFRNGLVLVGSETDIVLSGWSEPRFGFELVADAMNTMLTGEVLRWLGRWEHAAVILVMALLGAVLATNPLPRRLYWVAPLLFASALYMVAAAYAYAAYGLLLNAVYHLLALWTGYACARLVTHRWLRPGSWARTERRAPRAAAPVRSVAAILLCLLTVGCTRGYGRLQTVTVTDTVIARHQVGTARGVYIERAGRTAAAGRNARVIKGDRVRVDPGLAATFTVQGEYEVTLTDTAEVQILNPKIRLDRGRMRARRTTTGRPPRRRLRTETKYVVTGVAGTDFEIAVEPDDTVAIGVDHGLVAVAPKDRAVPCEQVLLLRAGDSIRFYREQIAAQSSAPVPGAVSEQEREEWVRSVVGDEPLPVWDLEDGWCLECLVFSVVFQELVEGTFRRGHSRVPRMVGLPLDSARALLQRQELEAGVICSRVTGEKAANTVLAQFPDSTSWLPEGEGVNLIVEAPSVSVPGLTGLHHDSASARLRSAGLATGLIVPDSTSPLPRGIVTGQEPVAGTRTRLGTNVSLRVSARPPVSSVLPSRVRVYFAFDVHTLAPGASAALDAIGVAVARDSSLSVEVEGHADRVGPEAYNLELSRRRAIAVAEYLVGRFGILAARIRACGFGESRPLATDARETGRARNRRAEVRAAPRPRTVQEVPC